MFDQTLFMATKGWEKPRLNGSQQSAMLTTVFPSFRQIRRNDPFIWEGTIRPTELSPDYSVRISYFLGKRPIVDVLAPKLLPRSEGGKIPHTFRPGRICLHLHEEWNSTMYIHKTIIPWTSLWLYYYELWHATGEWLGGGHELASPKGEK